uniref:Cadherin domain-containing protein n=1 Tax=Chelydra serpentina TaxID=8475 RepID=A0A8C3SQX5_CHESE
MWFHIPVCIYSFYPLYQPLKLSSSSFGTNCPSIQLYHQRLFLCLIYKVIQDKVDKPLFLSRIPNHYSRADSHRLVIEAWDGGSPRLSGRLQVEIRVLDENDNAPAFSQGEYRARVREDAAPGTAVCRLLATDPDLGANGEVRYLINRRQSDPAAYFAVEERTGLLRVNRPLDREARALHRVIVQARDGGAEPEVGSALVSIAVLDVNDNSPAIQVLYLTEGGGARLSEAARPGDYVARVSVSDPDEAGAEIGLTLQGEDGTFALRPGGAAGLYFLCVEGPLDRESRDLYELRLAATDAGSPPLSAHETLLLRIADINDQPPAFPQPRYRAAVSEAASPGTTVLRLSASDADEPGSPNAQVRYALEAAPGPELFHIDPLSGVISTRRGLDREREAALELRVVARDLGEPTQVNISVTDVNDNPPVFLTESDKITISHSTVPGTALYIARAEDKDSGLNGVIKYTIANKQSNAFTIDPSLGVVYLTRTLFTDKQHEYALHITAKDHGTPPLSSLLLLTVIITVLDENDNSPIFAKNYYQTSVREDLEEGSVILELFASDEDDGLNGEVMYSLIDDTLGAFTVNSTTGAIVTTKALDRETKSQYAFRAVASDCSIQGPRSTTVNIMVHIDDVNDNSPVFPQNPFKVYVPPETSVNQTIATVRAADVDLGPNGAVIFNFAIPGTMFRIDINTGEIYLQEPLPSDGFSSRLLVLASDQGVPARTATALLAISTREQKEVMSFSHSLYALTVPENSEAGGYQTLTHGLTQVSANDVDLSPALLYSFTEDGNPGMKFAINQHTGAITLVKPLDFEETAQYDSVIHLLIEAKDNGDPALTAVTSVEIQIQDVNNYAPQFTMALYNVSVSEDAPVGGTILTFSAIDYDWILENTYIEYSIISSNTNNLFHVETSVIESTPPYKLVGNLVLSSPLDREIASSHHVIILASDRATPPLNSTATVLITILDVNDNPPVFSNLEYRIHVRENIPIGSHITMVTANDCDAGANAEVTYTIISGNDNGHFQLDEKTGSVDLIRTLDYEKTIKFTLTIQASDGGVNVRNVAFSVVFVSVMDDNDYAPLFLFPSLNCVVHENLPAFSFVCTVYALDFDTGPYGHLTYSIQSSCLSDHGSPQDHDMFFIDPLTGDIQTKQRLDYESQNKYCFIAQAKDKGDSIATLTVQVDVEGTDEFDPVFTEDQYFFDLPEKNEAGQLVGKVAASDNDAGLDGVIHYSLLKLSPFFSVNQSNGNIYLTRTLHRKKSSIKRKDDTLELLVIAHSPKLDSKSTTCTVLVNISNSPENYSIASANILSISLTISFIVFLLLAISLIALILRYKRKDMINSCMKRETSSSSADLSLTNEDNIPKDCQKLQSTESSTLPMGSITEWLSLVGIREKEDISNPSRHSDSSGHGSAEGETAEDEEIKRINEHPCRKGLGSALSERGSCVPDSGIPRDSDQLSCQSGETDVLAATQNAESFHTFKDEGGEGCDPNYAHNKMLSQTLQKIGIKERDIMTDITREYIFISDGQDSRYGSLATLVASDEDLRGSYNWDYLLTWEPRFQPLASVFNDIAKLKDESLQIHSFPKEKKSFIFPPPLITSVAQPGIRTVPPHMPTIIPGQAFKKYPRSPLIHNLRYPSPAMTPSFSPSLSLLTMHTPTISPVMSDAGLTGTYQIGQIHATEEEVQV